LQACNLALLDEIKLLENENRENRAIIDKKKLIEASQ
jgi:autonomous glycyl radical cofactor GrcA